MAESKPSIEEVLGPRVPADGPHVPRKYAWSDSMTPGFSRTIDVCRQFLTPERSVLDVPCGKGEAMVRLAESADALMTGLDRSETLLRIAQQKVVASELGDRATLLLGDGGQLPFRENAFDACLSIGGPSCIGGSTIAEALREQTRVIRTGGLLIMSDMFSDPSYQNPWIEPDHPDENGWWKHLQDSGLRVIWFEHFPVSAWDEYHEPINRLVSAVLREFSNDAEKMEWADEVEKEIAIDRPSRNWAHYGLFVAEKR